MQQFLEWFGNQKLSGKLAIGCSTSYVLCCLCIVPTAILGQAGHKTGGYGTSVAEVQPSPVAQSQLPVAPLIFPPTSTLAPTGTLAPSSTPFIFSTLPASTSLFGSTTPAATGTLAFYFINVGQGDSTLIQTPDGKNILIDGGEASAGIVSDLRNYGVHRIDIMIATHPNSDHIGGLVQVLQGLPVTEVITNGQPESTLTYEHFLDRIISAKAQFVEVKRGDVIPLDGIDFHVLNPLNISSSDLNENSVVLQFTFGRTTFLMMGDSGAVTETELLSSGIPLKSDILKVGHHGSKSGSTLAFLEAVQPKIALYSAGVNNQYGLPAPQTIAALKAVGATVYGTDKDGTISIKVDQNGYTVNNVPVAASVLPTAPPASPSGPGSLEIVSVTSPVSKGSYATLTAKTSPNASCSITVFYKSGPSTAAGLVSKKADASGMVSWTWKVGSRTTSGTWNIDVTCNGVTQETTHEVR